MYMWILQVKFCAENFIKENSFLRKDVRIVEFLNGRKPLNTILLKAVSGADLSGFFRFFHTVGLRGKEAEFIEEDALSIRNKNDVKNLFKKACGGTLCLRDLHLLSVKLYDLVLNEINCNHQCNTIAAIDYHDDDSELQFNKNIFSLTVSVPPLKDRRDDLIQLVDRLLSHGVYYTRAFKHYLYTYSWPRDFEEVVLIMNKLKVFIEQHHLTTVDVNILHSLIEEADDLDILDQYFSFDNISLVKEVQKHSLKALSYHFEKKLIEMTLNAANGKKSLAARYLKIPPSTLDSKIKKFAAN